MGGIFGGSKPKAPAIVQEPTVVVDDQVRDQDAADANLRRRGRSSTILAGTSLGGSAAAQTQGAKTLLGA